MEAKCEICEEMCENDYEGCYDNCYATYGIENCDDNGDDALANFDPLDYAQCAEYNELKGGDDDNNAQIYLGPYCAEQGGSIYLGLFTDDTCTTFSSCGISCFSTTMGYDLPYGEKSLVSNNCMGCSENYLEDDDGYGEDDFENEDVREFCQNIYTVSGKCESRMRVEYPNESACTFIEGIKIIREDGVIRTTSVKKSKSAAVAIGLFSTVAVLLIAYVYYLRTSKCLMLVQTMSIFAQWNIFFAF